MAHPTARPEVLALRASQIRQLANAALGRPGGEAAIAAFRSELLAARGQVLAGLRAIPGVEAPAPDGGLYAFFRIEGCVDAVALAMQLVEEAGLGFAPGSAFGDEGQGWLRWCFAASPENNAVGLERLGTHLVR